MTNTIRTARSRSLVSRRKALMMSCGSAALAVAALNPQSAHAQAFQGNISSSTGSVVRSMPSTTTETLTIGTPTATINWTPSGQQEGGGTLNFLPSGNVATFTSSAGLNDYTVLNRILPGSGQVIGLNGTVVSTLQGTSATGGHVWFYAPNGILVGASAVFNVGGLLLTTNDVTSFGTSDKGFNATFSGPAGSTAKIAIEQGAQISALQQNSYIALVAPRIEQGGKVRVNRSAAYVAGEQLAMTMNQGLFDIQVDVGTTDSNGIVHTGETSGPANASAADNHTIYMVAVPKNQALTMLLSGNVGFDDAVSAQVQNGQIFLSSGQGLTPAGATYPGPALDSSIRIGPGNYTSDLTAIGEGLVTAVADTGNVSFGGNLSLYTAPGTGTLAASLLASNGNRIDVTGNVLLDSFLLSGSGFVSIGANTGGTVSIGGSAELDSLNGFSGGSASLIADGGSVSIAGPTHLDAEGLVRTTASAGSASDGAGGTVVVSASNRGAITTGSLLLDASGTGESNTGIGAGGNGQGGSIAILADSSGSMTANGNVTANANGTGGDGLLQAGTGTGGSVQLLADGGSISVNGDLKLTANGQGGAGRSAGDGYGGSVGLDLTVDGEGHGASATTTGALVLRANGTGGDGTNNAEGNGGQGGNGVGGSASLDMLGSSMTVGDMTILARGSGGAGGTGSAGAGGNGGNASGGTIDLLVDTGTNLTGGTYLASANAFGGNGGTGSTASGNGGSANSGANDASINGTATFGGNSNAQPFSTGFVMTAFAQGGTGNVGGSASAGSSSIDVSGSLSTTGILEAAAQAAGGNGDSTGGSAAAGSASIDVTGQLSSDSLFIGGRAIGGNGSSTGGDASGGTLSLSVFGGSANIANSTSLDASATGGHGFTAGTAGAGGIHVVAFGGTIGLGALSAQANGGDAGGSISFEAGTDGIGDPGHLHFGSLDAQANGGDLGGFITVTADAGSSVDLGEASLFASGAFGGGVTLNAGSCSECGASEAPLAQAALPAGGGIAANNLAINSSGNIAMNLSGGADISVAGTLNGNAGQMISISDDGTGGAIRAHEIDLSAISILGNADIFGDIIQFSAASDIDLGNVSATDSMNLTAGGNLTTADLAGGDIFLRGSDVSFGKVTGNSLHFNAGGFLTGGDVDVTTKVTGDAQGPVVLGNITAGPNIPTGTDFSVGISSASSISVGNVTGAGHVGFATPGDLTTGNLTAGDLVMLLVHGDISTGSVTTAASGRVYIGDASMFLTGGGGGEDSNFDPNIVLALNPVATGGSITIGGPITTGTMQAASGGDMTLGDVTAGTALTLNSGKGITTGNLNSPTVALTAANRTNVANVTASGSASFTAGGLASFTGIVNSPTITVTSGDINIGGGASLGVSGATNLVTLNAVSHGLPIIIGNGTAVEGQYQLNENGDIRATSLVINAQGSGGSAPDVDVFNTQIPGSATNGGGLTNVTLNTGGSVLVNGNVNFTNAGASDKLTINAGPKIEVNTDTGGIVMTDSAGNLAGTLDLTADNIWVGSRSLLDQLEANLNFTGRDAALGTNSGTANQDGFLRAGTINANVADSFLVQNSGTPQLFAGVDTGPGGLSVVTTAPTQATIIVYGRQTNNNGMVVTNQNFVSSVAVTGTGGFTTNSSVNGCQIGSAANCGQLNFTVDMSSVLGPLDQANSPSDEDKKKKDKQGDEGDDGSKADPNLRLINTMPINTDHRIEEPVTSGGDVVISGVQSN